MEVTLEDDSRPRQLEVTIRKVAVIPISSLKDFLRCVCVGGGRSVQRAW